MSPASIVPAAGCVVWRHTSLELEVALVHRPKYDDWSFPKGKVDSGEETYTTAVREVEEETGLRVSLGPRLADQTYDIAGGQRKRVSYWAARAPEDGDLSAYEPNAEIDEVRWVPTSRARDQLTHHRDVAQLEEFLGADVATEPLLIVRHAQARRRKSWHGPDSERPLRADGKTAAKRLVRFLSAYGVAQVVSSDAARCVETMLPYLNASRASIRLDSSLSEEGVHVGKLRRRVDALLADDEPAALCSHRPVLPKIFDALGLPGVSLVPGGAVVAHRRAGKVISVELYND